MQEILYLDLFKKPLSEIFVLSIIDQHIKAITGNWYLKLTPTVPFIAPVNNPANKTRSKYLLLVLFAGLLTGAMNGTVGVNFRYQLPVIAFICWSIIDNTNISLKGFLKRPR